MDNQSQPPSRVASLPLVGSELAFDFTNTASGRATSKHQEHLRTPGHVIAWSRHAKALTPADGDAAESLTAANPALGRELLARALELREVIYRIGSALARGEAPQAADTDALGLIHANCVARAKLTPFHGNFVWAWRPQDGLVESILGPIALSALTLLVQSDVSRVKQCGGGEHCGWLFFDTTKNKQRRWCEMEVCGNRAKQKAHRARLSAARMQIAR